MKMKSITAVMAILLASSLLLTACEKKLMYAGSSTKSKISASYKLFSGTEVKKMSLKSGETLVIDYESTVKRGKLSIKLYDPDQELVEELPANEAGNMRIEAGKDGKYKLKIVGDNTNGSFKIKYKTE